MYTYKTCDTKIGTRAHREWFMRVLPSLMASCISNINTLACAMDIIIATATNHGIHYYAEKCQIIAIQGTFIRDQQACASLLSTLQALGSLATFLLRSGISARSVIAAPTTTQKGSREDTSQRVQCTR